MNEVDENGWSHIHHAAARGFVKSIERFVRAADDQLEIETLDDLKSTPLLLAATSGTLDGVKCLIELGAKVWAINTQNHGVVEICALKQYISLLEYFIELNHDRLPVWKNLLKFIASDVDEEAEYAGRCIHILTQRTPEGINPNWQSVFSNGGVPVFVKVTKSSIGDEAKVQTFHCLLNIIENDDVKEQFLSSGGIPATVRLIKSSHHYVIQLASQTIKEVVRGSNVKYADQVVQNGAIPALVNVIQTIQEPEVLVQAVDALGNIAESCTQHQNTVGSTSGAIVALVNSYDNCTHKNLLMSLTHTLSKIANDNTTNQNEIVNEGGSAPIIMLTRVKYRDLQLAAVEGIRTLAENNPETQKIMLEEGAVNPLLQLLQKGRAQNIQERTAKSLWALAGDDNDERQNMATLMGFQLLIEFLNSLSEDLHYIGSEGIRVLAQGPTSKQDAIAQANGVHPLVRLLRSDKEYIVLSVIRTLQYLCVGVGYVPHQKNQHAVAQSRGIKFLVMLMVHSRDELIQVESALALGCVSLGNQDNLEEINENLDFSYVRILKMMYASNPLVRLTAGSALAAFSYNNINQQKEIAEQGGVRFNCFIPFLQSEDEFFRCNAAFQVVVLSRIIPDEEQAISSAAGIKLIVDLLQDSKKDEILGLAADCIARLSHTRAGIPAAFVSIQAVDLLCKLLLSPAEQVRGNAAIALGYLSYNPHAERQILNRCRLDPLLMKVLNYYTCRNKLSPAFVENWKHYKKIGLPPIESGRINLIGQKNELQGRPVTIISLGDNGDSNLHGSPNNNIHDDNHTSRSSRAASRATNQSISVHRSQHSQASYKSHSVLSNASSVGKIIPP